MAFVDAARAGVKDWALRAALKAYRVDASKSLDRSEGGQRVGFAMESGLKVSLVWCGMSYSTSIGGKKEMILV